MSTPHNPVNPTASPEEMAPPPHHARSLYACNALPLRYGELHPMLRISSSAGELFDVSYDPAHPLSMSPRALALEEPATSPPLPCISLIFYHLPWKIDIRAGSENFVTVADVCKCKEIYSALHLTVTTEELANTPVSDRPFVLMAFQKRCERMLYEKGASAAERERRKRVKRVDYLFVSHRFAGLAPTPQMPDIWELLFSSS
ncbi:hypothetical protein B0H10DRAFT_2223531 [Mycena sp. CBHHK59/15]|nr:hypothetical protein B0H10DRAFT_2223531 [Mycena sp. CBHHK59/15]